MAKKESNHLSLPFNYYKALTLRYIFVKTGETKGRHDLTCGLEEDSYHLCLSYFLLF
jgi:hypothetical protein